MESKLTLILGVTASGKGRLAFEIARQTGAEIISVDSMKVYRRMDIGTAKPPEAARLRVPYHLVDVVEPSQSFDVAQFVNLAETAIEKIRSRDRSVVAVGGTALYLKALLYGLFEGPGRDEAIRMRLGARAAGEGSASLYEELLAIDPETAARISPNDTKRIIRGLEVFEITGRPISTFQNQWDAARFKRDWTIIGLRRERLDQSQRINARVKAMIEAGLVDEVRSLLAEESPLSGQARCAIGYAEIIDYLDGGSDLPDTIERIKKNTRRFAKGQRTWFKTFPRVRWLDVPADESSESMFGRAMALLAEPA